MFFTFLGMFFANLYDSLLSYRGVGVLCLIT